MLQAILVAALQYAVPSILAFVEAYQKANAGAMPTPAQVLQVPEVQILAQGAAWLDANRPVAVPAPKV
jgi:hypothetical protein